MKHILEVENIEINICPCCGQPVNIRNLAEEYFKNNEEVANYELSNISR